MLNDNIKRADVLKLFDEWGGGFKYIEVETDGAIEAVNALTSAQPEELTCEGCKYEKTSHDLCVYCFRGYDDFYEENA